MAKAKVSLTKQELEVEVSKDEAEAFINRILPDSVKNLGGMLNDNIITWRFERQLKHVLRVKELVKESGLSVQEVPLKILAPILEGAALEEDATLQEKWANMMTNAVIGQYVRPAYADILKEFSPLEITILDTIYQTVSKRGSDQKITDVVFSTSAIAEHYGLKSEEGAITVENYYRHRVCQSPVGGALIGDYPIASATSDGFCLTNLGYDFVKQCSRQF